MIDSKDLRLLNLVLHDGVMCEVIEVGFEWFKLNNGQLNTPVEEVDPIPLTEHWLERLGFRKIKDEKSYCEDGDYTLVSNRFQVFTNDILTYNSIHGWWIDKKQFFIPCQYVHQLQNFHFALTGKELELTKQ